MGCGSSKPEPKESRASASPGGKPSAGGTSPKRATKSSVVDRVSGHIVRELAGVYPVEYGPRVTQDTLLAIPGLEVDPDLQVYGVFDGHGPAGHFVSRYVAKSIRRLCEIPGALDKANLRRSVLKIVLRTDKGVVEAGVDCSESGSTGIFGIVYGDRLLVANVGDSRAVLARRKGASGKTVNGNAGRTRIEAVDLSSDQTPFRKDEYDRIRAAGGRVLTVEQLQNGLPEQYVPEEGFDGDPPRVWAGNGLYPGTAFSRSFGDRSAREAGVICEPEFTETVLDDSALFAIFATDGVWEFVSSQEAVEVVTSKGDDLGKGLDALIKLSVDRWTTNEGRTDDIAIVLVQFSSAGADAVKS